MEEFCVIVPSSYTLNSEFEKYKLFSDRQSDSFEQNLIPSDRRSERSVKIDTFRSLI